MNNQKLQYEEKFLKTLEHAAYVRPSGAEDAATEYEHVLAALATYKHSLMNDLVQKMEGRKLFHEIDHKPYEGCYECEHNGRIDEDINIITATLSGEVTDSSSGAGQYVQHESWRGTTSDKENE